jgi:hypothetical protein
MNINGEARRPRTIIIYIYIYIYIYNLQVAGVRSWERFMHINDEERRPRTTIKEGMSIHTALSPLPGSNVPAHKPCEYILYLYIYIYIYIYRMFAYIYIYIYIHIPAMGHKHS